VPTKCRVVKKIPTTSVKLEVQKSAGLISRIRATWSRKERERHIEYSGTQQKVLAEWWILVPAKGPGRLLVMKGGEKEAHNLPERRENDEGRVATRGMGCSPSTKGTSSRSQQTRRETRFPNCNGEIRCTQNSQTQKGRNMKGIQGGPFRREIKDSPKVYIKRGLPASPNLRDGESVIILVGDVGKCRKGSEIATTFREVEWLAILKNTRVRKRNREFEIN